jgi:hypothetical protein
VNEVKPCRVCKRDDFETWLELATHILQDHKPSRNKDVMASRKWASNFKYKKVLYNQSGKKDFVPTALTESQREAKQDSRRILSGEKKFVTVKCPKCKMGRRDFIEAEHIESPQAWKLDGCFMKLCEGCR